MKFGYIRVSTLSQDFYRQQMELLNNGVMQENIFEEKVSGTKKQLQDQHLKKWSQNYNQTMNAYLKVCLVWREVCKI